MSKQNVAGLVVEALRSHGGSDWVHTRHEEAAAFAAGGEAHLTGGLAVCAGSCGPGNLHLINGLFDCHRSRLPVLAIAAQMATARQELATPPKLGATRCIPADSCLDA